MNTYSMVINVKTTATPFETVFENIIEIVNADSLDEAKAVIETNLSLTTEQQIEIVRINYVHQHKAIEE